MSDKSKKTATPAHTGAGRPLSGRPEGPGTAFANFLIDYLPTVNLTNEEIAYKMGYKRPNIVSMWKAARTRITLDAVWPLSAILDVDPAYLMALYFEQYTADQAGGVNNFPDIVKMMARVATPEEWEIIQIAREARRHNSVPLKAGQKSELKKLFKVDGIAEGPLREIEMNFGTSGDRRTFARRGRERDSLSEESVAAADKASGETGPRRKAGKSVPA